MVDADKVKEIYAEFCNGGEKKVVHYENDCKISIYKVEKVIRMDIKPMED